MSAIASFRRLLVGALLALALCGAASAQVVVSQVYGGGGNANAIYNQKYVELFNAGANSASLDGLSVQYGASAGNFSQKTDLPNVTMPAGSYFLLGLGSGANGDPLPVTPDATGGWSPAGVNGKVALFNTTVLQACGSTGGTPNPCSPAQLALILDLVGYGSATFFEGSGPAPATSSTASAFRADGGCTDTDDNAADFTTAEPAPRNSASTLNDCGAAPLPSLSIDDVAADEGDVGLTDFVFTVTLIDVVGGAVTVNYTTVDGSAVAGVDYEATAGTLNFAGTEGETQTITVQVIGNTEPEATKTFTVVLSDPDPADVQLTKAVGTGSILNDDVYTITPIHDIQGSGQVSPLLGEVHATQGIVTGIRTNSFFIQTPDADVDLDPNTSEGLFMFVGFGNVPGWMAVGDLVTVRGTVVEFIPTQDPFQLPITQLGSVDVIQLNATGQPLPAAIVLDPMLLTTDDGLEQLERFEFMRVRIPEFLVTAPTRPGSTDEYFGVIAGTDRPFRERGVDIQDQPLPAEAPAFVPLWDFNPELIRVKSNLLIGGQATPFRAGTVLENVEGVLDYGFRRYTVLTTAANAPIVVSTPTGTATSAPLPQDILVGGFNVENLSGTGGVTFTRKANKMSEVMRDFLHYPDIFGISEVAGQPTLEALATIVNADAVTAGDPNPEYSAHVLSTSGTQRLGYLLKTANVSAGTPRVEVLDLEEVGAGLGMVCPDGSLTNTDPGAGPTGLLNDRAPLVLRARVNAANDANYELIVVNNHLKSLIGINSRVDASGAYACFNEDAKGVYSPGGEGRRNRAKRQQNAEYLAMLVADLQDDNPGLPIVLVGDFNAFEFNDGYADLMGTIAGIPSPDDQTVVPDDGIDFVDPDLIPLTILMPPDQRYSYVFGGNAQALDHVLVNEAVVDTTVDVRKEFARVNADFTYADATDTGVAFRSSDHDPTQAYLTVSAFFTADLQLNGNTDVNEALIGDTVTFALNLGNSGGDDAVNPRLFVNLPAGTGFLNHTAPLDWSCDVPVTGNSGSFGCFAGSGTLTNGSNVDFSFEVEMLPAAGGTSVILSASAEADSTDPTSPNLASDSVDVAGEADLALAAVAQAALVTKPDLAIVDFTASNSGPNAADLVSVTLSVAGLVPDAIAPSVSASAGWDCDAFIVVGGSANALCNMTSFAVGEAEFEVSVSSDAASGSSLAFSATIASPTTDPQGGNESANASVEVNNPPSVDPASFTVLIGTPNGFVIGQINASDADADPLSYTLSAGNADGAFAIDADGLLTVADSALITADRLLTVTVDDGRGGEASATITITTEDPTAQPGIFADGFESD